jgi:hypothetical protein
MQRHALRYAAPFAALLLVRCTCATPGTTCETAADCSAGQVCDPTANACTAELECQDDADCGDNAVCVEDACAPLVSADDCVDDGDCAGTQTCRNGTCRDQLPEDSPCTSAEECAEPLVCDPATNTCEDDVDCDENADCGDAAYCANAGACAPAEPNSPCETDDDCIAAERCVGIVCVPDVCEATAFSAEPIPANVMITIDRSGSMDSNIGNDGSKWDVGRAAIEALLATASPAISFGLNVYPGFNQSCSDGQNCAEGVVALPVGSSRDDIVAYLNDAETCSFRTPTAENLEILLDEPELQDPMRNNFVLLITDGQSTCDNPVNAVEDLFAQSPPVRTFVVGFGDGVDPDELEDMANAGGTARQSDPIYYQADNAVSLEQAFVEIAGSVLGCEYTIDVSPDEDPEEMGVFFNGQLVPRDTTGQTGWDVNLAAGRLTFAGNACRALQTGLVTDLTLVYGCPLPEQPPDVDAGPDPDPEPTPEPDMPPDGCDDVCEHSCFGEACLVDQGECGPCRDDGDCCPGSLCFPDGACVAIGG